MKARPNSRPRLLLPTMPLLNKRLPPKIGEPLEMVITGVVEMEAEVEVVILNGVPKLATPSGVPKVVTLTGPPLLPLPPPPRTPMSLPSGPTAVPGTVKRKSQTTR